MCKDCGHDDKPVQYRCTCEEECTCSVIGFDKVPNAVPYCCGRPMKRVK